MHLDLRLREHELHRLPLQLHPLALLLQLLLARELGRLHERQPRIHDQPDDDQEVRNDRQQDLLEASERPVEDGRVWAPILQVEVHQ